MSKVFLHGLSENEKIAVEDMTVGELAARLKCSVSTLIVELLSRGIVANKNQLIKKDQIIKFLKDFAIPFFEPLRNSEHALERAMEAKSSLGQERRLPVVAVVGHVDHGKTSFLDYLRKTKVAAKEKGGITQHVAAYEVVTPQGNLVFLDTPGHEAFSMMRERGVLIADLVVLMVALDDGVKPQTVESIKKIKELGAMTVVALNKIDKAKVDRIDVVKKQLADYGLVADDWGGDTPMVAISAKTGQGVDELLEVIRLQSDILDLKTSSTEPAKGAVLESMMEYGRGAVATVILHRGILTVGDYFICGATFGRVSSMKNCFGQKLEKVGASIPVVIAGFSSLPEAGDIFEYASSEQVKKYKANQSKMSVAGSNNKLSNDQEGTLSIIVKAATLLSKEALLASLKKLNEKHEIKIKIVDSGIGDINESNLDLAITTNAIIYGLYVKVNKLAIAQAKRPVTVKTFDIIYKLLEDIELLLENNKKQVIEETQIGVARVKAIFKVKSIGVIAGAVVLEGVVQKGCKIRVYRSGVLVGSGTIKTLQKERTTVATVSQNNDCAFSVDSFSGWKIDDEVRCFVESVK
ncbi:translation initiation factor IF-2 [Candidatus Dependentiae bacterium]|nr:translation initiation factor IF-2 [Candidatus Dependentiae bacterium]